MRVDAYCHVGLPRFGTAEDALTVAGQWAIEKSVLVLGPQVPDYGTLFDALRVYGDRVRGVGIPFGETAEQIEEVAALQLRAGVMGLRMELREVLAYPRVLKRLGERGRWLYAIGALASREVVETLLKWLERYPDAKVAAPHFLEPRPLFDDSALDGLTCALLLHPRFHAIFSRHGGMGSREPYPHKDFTVWVETVIEAVGWERVLWGSEYPVIHWRSETMSACLGWLPALLGGLTSAQEAAFLGGNAQRLIFDVAAPDAEPVIVPAWVEAQFNRNRTVPLFADGLDVPMDVYQRLHHRYVQALRDDPALTFAEFVVDQWGHGQRPAPAIENFQNPENL